MFKIALVYLPWYLSVSASDKDGSTVLSYTVTDPTFSITTSGNGQIGVIKTNG